MVADYDVTTVMVTVTGFQKSVIGFDILPTVLTSLIDILSSCQVI